MEMFGWTTWGWCEFGGDLGTARLYKHHTGLVAAIPESYQEDPFLLLSQMSRYLEDEAGIERKPSEAEQQQEQADLIQWQTYQDMRETLIRLDAENAQLRDRLGMPRVAEAPASWLKDKSAG